MQALLIACHERITVGRGLKAITPELPILLLTADNSMKIKKNALSCGIMAVFSKLGDFTTLLANARAACGIE
jgi:DNA-binding NarL/FixJ family response regulator